MDILFSCLCKALEADILLRCVFQFIGMHTLLIFLIHHLDWIAGSIWKSPSTGMALTLRILIVFAMFFLVYVMENVS